MEEMKTMRRKEVRNRAIGIVLIIVSLIVLGIVSYMNSLKPHIPIVFSERQLLTSLWENYKTEYLEPGTGRTLDKQQNNITTSEGESYTMLRAVWLDDKQTFDSSYKWTKDILKHDDDNLFSWLFGQRSDGSYGILTERGGQNAASDADSDIALSLIFAYSKWKDPAYLADAKGIISDIWDKEVVVIDGKPILAANDIEKNSADKIIVDPSYFSPYAYKIFAKIDPQHDWLGLASSSYEIIEESSEAPLDKPQSAGIPPDWIEIDRHTGEIKSATVSNPSLTTNYSYDALRVPWRLALDWQWNKDPRAKKALDGFEFFSREWRNDGQIKAVYSHDGAALQSFESPAAYGGAIGYFLVSDPGNAADVYEKKLQILYNPNTNSWKNTLGYYDDNWAWFGIALYNNALPNLAADLPQSSASATSTSALTGTTTNSH